MKTFNQWLESVEGVPETDEEAKLRLPHDPSIQLAYDNLRKKGQSPADAWNYCIQNLWKARKQGFATIQPE